MPEVVKKKIPKKKNFGLPLRFSMAAAAAAGSAETGPEGRGQRMKRPRGWHDDNYQVGRCCNY